MKVGYVSGDYIRKTHHKTETLITECLNKSLSLVVLTGGISENYISTLEYINKLGSGLRQADIKLRFIYGNTDFYYKESVVNKIEKFYEIKNTYNTNEYCLMTHPIIKQKLWIIGTDTWYDYSLYRGNPIQLKTISKKKKFFKKNRDNDYITDSGDYVLGVNNTFDCIYTKECLGSLDRNLNRYEQRMLDPVYKVIVGYFYSSKVMLMDSMFENYFGTFKGSDKMFDILQKHKVTDYICGIKARSNTIKYNGVSLVGATDKIYEVTYNES